MQLSQRTKSAPPGVVRQDSQKRPSQRLQWLEQLLHTEDEQPLHIQEQSLQKQSLHRSQHE